jgi:GTP-binding protein
MLQVAIVGYPNAGKSTLFNRLLRQKRSLVHALPGMTRDRIGAPCVLGGKSFELIDTGGFLDSGAIEPLSAQVKDIAWTAAKMSDLVILLLDGRNSLIPAEMDLYRALKKLDKPLIVAVNKIDTEGQKTGLGDYYKLGEPRLYFISAEHKIGLGELEEAIADALPESARDAAPAALPLKIALIGRTNVGKSSLANRLCGEDRFLVSGTPGTTRDSADILVHRGAKSYILIDMAGIRKLTKVSDERESAGVIKAKKNIPLADVLCLVLDAGEFPAHQDAAVAKLAFESGKPLLIALNKWDLLREDEANIARASKVLFARLEFISYAPLVTVSALTGKRSNQIFEMAEKVFRNGQKKIPTPRLNKFLEEVQATRGPISKLGQRFRIKYATQHGILPPTFVLFGNAKSGFAPAYEKFFVQKLREAFEMWGTPIRLVLK